MSVQRWILCVALILAVVIAGQRAVLAQQSIAFDQDALLQDETSDSFEEDNFESDDFGRETPFDEPLVTDRPDFTEASSTVGLGVVQLEMGYTFVFNDDDATGDETYTHTAPETLLRVGFLENVELRVGWTYVWESTEVSGIHASTDGGSDLSIGLKIDLFEQCCWRPEQAILVSTASDSGATNFSSNTFTTNVAYLYSWELPNEWSLSANSGFFTDREGNDDFVVWLQSIALGIPLTDVWGMYVEYFGLYETQKAGAVDQHFMDGGITYLWNYNLQFDVRAGFGLNGAADDFFTGTGVSMRF